MLRTTKPPRCKVCKSRLDQLRPGQVVHLECVDEYVRRLRAEKAERLAKAERQIRRKRKEAIKTRRDWIAEAQQAVNKYVRLRDQCAGLGCISCGARPEQKFGGAVDAGHFRSVGSAPHLRFLTTQIALQCVRCNRYLSGNAVEFRRGLVDRRGLAVVEQIEVMQGVGKWSVDYLRRLKSIMGKKSRRLEKRYAMQG